LSARRGAAAVPKAGRSGDAPRGVVREAGAEELDDEGETFEIISEATDVVAVRTALQQADIDYDRAEAQFVPTMRPPVDLDGAQKALRLIEGIEASSDVPDVY